MKRYLIIDRLHVDHYYILTTKKNPPVQTDEDEDIQPLQRSIKNENENTEDQMAISASPINSSATMAGDEDNIQDKEPDGNETTDEDTELTAKPAQPAKKGGLKKIGGKTRALRSASPMDIDDKSKDEEPSAAPESPKPVRKGGLKKIGGKKTAEDTDIPKRKKEVDEEVQF